MSLNLILLLINNSFSLPELSPIAKRQFYLQKAWQPKHAHKETTCVIFPKVLNTSNNYSEKGDWYRSNQSNGTFTIYLFFNQHCWSLICVGPCKNLEVATNGSLKYVTKLYSTTPEHVDRTYFGSEYMSVQMVICPKNDPNHQHSSTQTKKQEQLTLQQEKTWNTIVLQQKSWSQLVEFALKLPDLKPASKIRNYHVSWLLWITWWSPPPKTYTLWN